MEHILFTGIDTQNGKSMYKYKRAKFQFALSLLSYQIHKFRNYNKRAETLMTVSALFA
jgi:hypothetical protein